MARLSRQASIAERTAAARLRGVKGLGRKLVSLGAIAGEAPSAAYPDMYRTLSVRVVGYSAYFVALTRRVQDDIIRRTEYMI